MTAEATAPTAPVAGPRFETKVNDVLGEGLTAWQELNVTACLMTGIDTSAPDLTGQPYGDGDGAEYLPTLREPVLVMSTTTDLIRKVRSKAVTHDVALVSYTRELFDTGHDAANRAEVTGVASADFDLVGIALRGPRNAVDRIVEVACFHD